MNGIRVRLGAAAAMLAAFTLAAAQPMYRCVIDGVTTFSDRPCADDARPHAPAGRLSFIAPADDLADVAEANRDFVERRRAQLAAARAIARRNAAATAPVPERRERTRPWWSSIPLDPNGAVEAPDPRLRAAREAPPDPSRDVDRRALLRERRDTVPVPRPPGYQ
jgi:hypothetical protein